LLDPKDLIKDGLHGKLLAEEFNSCRRMREGHGAKSIVLIVQPLRQGSEFVKLECGLKFLDNRSQPVFCAYDSKANDLSQPLV
jgi:hypothetical protein